MFSCRLRSTSFTIHCAQNGSAENGQTKSVADFEEYLNDLRGKIGDGAGLAFLVEETHSPTRERIRGELEKSVSTLALVCLIRCG